MGYLPERRSPAGFEGRQDRARQCVNDIESSKSADLSAVTHGHARRNCNECNEVVPRLARVAKNALMNGDFPHVVRLLDRLSGSVVADDGPPVETGDDQPESTEAN
jgi:hypothetical protein